MLLTSVTKVGMMKAGVGQYAWNLLNYAVPATQDGRGIPSTADERQLGKGESASIQRNHGNSGSRDAGRPDEDREERKLQAEDDCVVLLCRD